MLVNLLNFNVKITFNASLTHNLFKTRGCNFWESLICTGYSDPFMTMVSKPTKQLKKRNLQPFCE